MLKLSLVGKSQALEKNYMPSIIKELRVANSSELDSFLFGALVKAYQSNNTDVLQPESKKNGC